MTTEKLKLPKRFVLLIEGDLSRVSRRAVVVPSELPYLVERLLRGEQIALSAFSAYGLRVTIEEHLDQTDDALLRA